MNATREQRTDWRLRNTPVAVVLENGQNLDRLSVLANGRAGLRDVAVVVTSVGLARRRPRRRSDPAALALDRLGDAAERRGERVNRPDGRGRHEPDRAEHAIGYGPHQALTSLLRDGASVREGREEEGCRCRARGPGGQAERAVGRVSAGAEFQTLEPARGRLAERSRYPHLNPPLISAQDRTTWPCVVASRGEASGCPADPASI